MDKGVSWMTIFVSGEMHDIVIGVYFIKLSK